MIKRIGGRVYCVRGVVRIAPGSLLSLPMIIPPNRKAVFSMEMEKAVCSEWKKVYRPTRYLKLTIWGLVNSKTEGDHGSRSFQARDYPQEALPKKRSAVSAVERTGATA